MTLQCPQKTVSHSTLFCPLLLRSYILFTSSLIFSNPWGECSPFRTELSLSVFLALGRFWVLIAHYKKRLLWWRLRSGIIYGYKDECLEDRSTTGEFSKSTVVGSTRAQDLPSSGLLARLTVSVFPVDQVSNTIRNRLVTPILVMPLLHQWAYLAWHIESNAG